MSLKVSSLRQFFARTARRSALAHLWPCVEEEGASDGPGASPPKSSNPRDTEETLLLLAGDRQWNDVKQLLDAFGVTFSQSMLD